jgi:hypothetical protein
MDKQVIDFQVNNICEAFGCSKKATTKISVKVGHLGSIFLALCANCTEKFDVKDLACERRLQSQHLGVEDNDDKELR